MCALYGVCLLKGHYKKLHSQVAFHSYGNLPKIIAVPEPCQEPPEIFQPFQTQNHYNCTKTFQICLEPSRFLGTSQILSESCNPAPILPNIPFPSTTQFVPAFLHRQAQNPSFRRWKKHIIQVISCQSPCRFPTITWVSNVH